MIDEAPEHQEDQLAPDPPAEGAETSQEAAADSEEDEQSPPQDETDSTVFDTEEHSDAPGPFGTG